MIGIVNRHNHVCDHAAPEEISNISVHRCDNRFATHKRVTIATLEDDIGGKESSGPLEFMLVCMTTALRHDGRAFALNRMHLFDIDSTTLAFGFSRKLP